MVEDSSFVRLNDFNFATNQRTRRDSAQDSLPREHQAPFADPKKSDAIGESCSRRSLKALDKLAIDKFPLSSNPDVANIVQIGKNPIKGTADYVDGVEASTLNQQHMNEQFHAKPGAIFHFISAGPVETIVNIQINQHNIGSQSTTLCHDISNQDECQQIVTSYWSKVLGQHRVDIMFQRIQCVAQELAVWNKKKHKQLFTEISCLRRYLATVNNDPSAS
ncbi:hypothetical protein ACOSQ3_026854 [Xanthoceras sorbifolium]